MGAAGGSTTTNILPLLTFDWRELVEVSTLNYLACLLTRAGQEVPEKQKENGIQNKCQNYYQKLCTDSPHVALHGKLSVYNEV